MASCAALAVLVLSYPCLISMTFVLPLMYTTHTLLLSYEYHAMGQRLMNEYQGLYPFILLWLVLTLSFFPLVCPPICFLRFVFFTISRDYTPFLFSLVLTLTFFPHVCPLIFFFLAICFFSIIPRLSWLCVVWRFLFFLLCRLSPHLCFALFFAPVLFLFIYFNVFYRFSWSNWKGSSRARTRGSVW